MNIKNINNPNKYVQNAKYMKSSPRHLQKSSKKTHVSKTPRNDTTNMVIIRPMVPSIGLSTLQLIELKGAEKKKGKWVAPF